MRQCEQLKCISFVSAKMLLKSISSHQIFRPTNLKTLFRPVTMVQPETMEICEISLYASGYSNAKSIAKKIAKLYEICANLLPFEAQYDFGKVKNAIHKIPLKFG